MSTFKGTPGPWGLSTVPTSAGSCHRIGPFPSNGVRREAYACVYADGVRLGLDDANPVAQELLANARLIAAAPELLEALEDLASLAEAAMREVGEYNIEAELADARAAIAKAKRGEG